MARITLNFSATLSEPGKAAAKKLIAHLKGTGPAPTQKEWQLLKKEGFIFKIAKHMAKKTKPAWETELLSCSIYKTVKLKVDGHKLTVQAGIHKNRIVYSWFVDGVWKGEYMTIGNEIGAKFGAPKMIRPPKKSIEWIRLTIGKKAAAAEAKKRILVCYLNYWGSLRSMAAHLKKTCSQIEIITEE